MRLTPEQAVKLGVLSREEARAIGRADKRAAPRGRYRRAVAEDSPQALLQRLLLEAWPGETVAEYAGAVPGRRFRLDVGFPSIRLAVECDGWEHHGKYKGDFQRDRERDRLLLLHGWRVLRFYASEIRRDPAKVLEQVGKARNLLKEEARKTK